jgi:lipopolysaccharide export system protein LptA
MKKILWFSKAGLRLFIACLASVSLLAHAVSEDRKKPVSLKADRVTFDQQKGFSTYEGRVMLVQGSMSLDADRMTVQLNKNQQIEEINAYGAPGHFKDKMDDGTLVKGHAKRIRYLLPKNTVYLIGDAVVIRGTDQLRGESIAYELSTGFSAIEGASNAGRQVEIIFTPKAGKEDNE